MSDEAEQQLSRLAPSACQLFADVLIFGAGLQVESGRHPPIPRLHLKFQVQEKQAAPVSMPLCEQCHGQMRLSNSFPG